DYTGVPGGGAVAQFFRTLPKGWSLDDHTLDGCMIPQVPRDRTGHIITLTIGGNDALSRYEELRDRGVAALVADHYDLLAALRRANPESCLIVGTIYEPQMILPDDLIRALWALNDGMRANIRRVDGCIAEIHGAFRDHEDEYLCQDIEPSLAGASVIARLFAEQWQAWRQAAE
ncbi:MAG TPA: SGNH/GDSL hydrolase family protein, partial [Acidobacteriota bacterium]|nr:SGNH/GDSL hydrolase family protein [Acidobacteriota bacterium]